jgi:glycosyltransferase involved in cell wall biosynthesis
MRVLVVADVMGGVRTFVGELARDLTGRGVEVHLALIGSREQVEPLLDLPVASLDWRPYALEWMGDPWDDVERTADWVAELAGALRPDVLHMNTFTPVADDVLPALLTVHSCVLSWWRAVRGEDAPPQWDRYRRLAERTLERAQTVVAPTAALMSLLCGLYGPLPSARVIANGSSLPPGETGPREPLVITVGRVWDEAKNAATLATAAPAIHGRVAAIGQGPAPGLHSLGALPHREVITWLRRSAVFAEPARYEPFGLAALEAARSGCALVLGDIPSLREVWGDAAAYVPPDDPDALADAVNRLLDDPVACEAAAARALARSERYSASATGAAYHAALAAIASVPVP